MVSDKEQIYSYDMLVRDLEELTGAYPGILTSEAVGKSVDGRDIYRVTLGDPKAPKRIFVDAAIHGREYITSQFVMNMIEHYASEYNNMRYNNIPLSELFGEVCIDIIPMANPDGVTISQYGEEGIRNEELRKTLRDCYERDKEYLVCLKDDLGFMYWADNYRLEGFDRAFLPPESSAVIGYEDYLTIWKSNANGVDINQNFDAGWEDADYKTYPSFGQSKGESYASEPETQLLIRESKKHDYVCYLNYHSRGQILYYDSYGIKDEVLSESYKLALKLSEFNGYIPFSTKAHDADRAGFGDYVHVVLEKPGVTIEMGRAPSPVPVSELKGILEKNLESWAYLAYKYSR